MKRIPAILILSLLFAGCTSRAKPLAPPESFAPRSTEPGYLEGFVNGYLSAFPDKPYTLDLRAYRPGPPYRYNSYRRGWHDGYHTGRRDKRQRD
ncbi:MAG: hypothetical protein JW993_17470 [Sedimentisphaerales bacterium]|nr:hypothetical protein [Sedimentisphaerales bacterium]